jgi:hypothetical protein
MTRPACWRWKPPTDIGAVLLTAERRRKVLELGGKGLKYIDLVEHQAQWTLLRRWHRFRCAVCGESASTNDKLVRDHDHETGFVRGLLCNSCNTTEGFGGGPMFDKYRERPPVAICGVQLKYAAGIGAMALAQPPELQGPVGRPPGAADGEVVSILALTAICNAETVTAADCRDYAEGRADLLTRAAGDLITSWTRWDLARRVAAVRLLVEAGADESLIDGWPGLMAQAEPAA